MATLYVFMRHAESVANAGGWLSGWEDVPLTARGEEQALAAAPLVHTHPFGRCLVSDLQRARATRDFVLGSRVVPTHIVPDLRERHMGALQGQNIAEARADGRLERFILGWETTPPGGEAHVTSARRALAALRHWHDGTVTLVVAHGSVIRDVVGLLDGVPRAEIGRMRSAVHADPIVRHVTTWPDA